jgi:5S rRNA maturation endonuclease (ribonuclease M5)
MREGVTIITIRGIVIPVDWDEKGKVIAAALSTHKEDEYLIDHDYKGQELLHHIQKEVEVSGVVRKNNGKKIIVVQKYILKSFL